MHKREEFSVKGGKVVVFNDGDGVRIIFVREGKEESACPDLYVEREETIQAWQMFAHSEEGTDTFMRIEFGDKNLFRAEPESPHVKPLTWDLS